MSRFDGLSEERPSVFKTPSKLGTHLSTQCSGDERQSRPCPARYFRDTLGSYDNLFFVLGVISVVASATWMFEKCLLPKNTQLQESGITTNENSS
ncbi:hypothetical protein TNCV_1843451 [Trichonephila clavipes]|nr:hypothetical protein TNCV_1843451 [Trichonephila clavipes]